MYKQENVEERITGDEKNEGSRPYDILQSFSMNGAL